MACAVRATGRARSRLLKNRENEYVDTASGQLAMMCGGSLIAAPPPFTRKRPLRPPSCSRRGTRRCSSARTGDQSSPATQIQGAKINDVLPVTVVDEIDIQNIAGALGTICSAPFRRRGASRSTNRTMSPRTMPAATLPRSICAIWATGKHAGLDQWSPDGVEPGFQTDYWFPWSVRTLMKSRPGSVRRH